ncbi:MAG: 5-formyltetrahydrofolate cyclo-ligase [Alphaproteobacteria bacterium]|nr:5-formyltetrahydrofolate cyclo-ligase [Alphaproteobacteria bacterium]
MDIAALKQALRADALVRRAALRAAHPTAARDMAENFLDSIPLKKSAAVSAYIAIGDEPDARPLMKALREHGCPILLPRVVAKEKPLAFHRYESGAQLVPGPFGLSQPDREWPQADPDVLIVPLLAFDADGNRLGYGGGFYDRTLKGLRARKKVLAVGFALSKLERDEVPHHEGDEKLDWIVTEKIARKF